MRSFRFIFLVMIFSIFFQTISAQTENGDCRSLLNEYSMNEPILIMIIREYARSTSKEQKMISLNYVEEIIVENIIFENELFNNDKYEVLKYLAYESTVYKTTVSGRVLPDFPEVRIRAVKLLGQLITKKAKNILLKVLEYENDILVLQEAIKTLFSNWTDFYNNKEEMKIIINALEKISKQK